MGIMGIFEGIFKSETKDYQHCALTVDQVPGSLAPATIEPNAAYLEVLLTHSRVPNVREGFKEFYPAAYCSLQVDTYHSGAVTFQKMTTAEALKAISKDDLSNVIQLQQRLMGPVVYRGGDVKYELGLYILEQKDLAKPFLSLLSTVSTLTTGTFVSNLAKFAAPIVDAVNIFTNAGKSVSLEIGISNTLTQATGNVKSGYYLTIKAEKDEIDLSTVKLDLVNNTLLDKGGKQIKKAYFVHQVIGSTRHNTWFLIPEVKDAYKKIRSAAAETPLDSEKLKQLLAGFRPLAMMSDDLHPTDGERLYCLVKKEIEGVVGLLPGVPQCAEPRVVTDGVRGGGGKAVREGTRSGYGPQMRPLEELALF